jgi:serine phosphatase RsbU (regulator of sigma subunit)
MLFQKFFQPAIKLTSRLKYPQKFLLISLLFAAPLSLAMGLLGTELQSRSDFAEKEQIGLVYLRSLKSLWWSLPNLYSQVLEQDQLPATTQWEAARAEFMQDLAKLAATDQRWGATLKTTPKLIQIQAAWQHIHDREKQWSPETKVAEYQNLFAQLDELRTIVGDQSNLVLDPDLDTYYLMDAVLLKVPLMQHKLAEIRSLSRQMTGQRTISPTDRAQLLALSGVLQDQNRAIRQGMETAFKSSEVTINLRPQLAPFSDQFINSTQLLAREIEQLAYDNKLPEPYKYYLLANQGMTNAVPFWHQSAVALDQRLDRRIQGLTQRQMMIGLFAIVVLLLVTYVFIGFYITVMQTVNALSAASRQMIDGVQTEPVVLDSKDELSQVVTSFNQLARALVSSHGQVLSLNQQLKYENTRMSTELDVTRRLQEMMLPRREELQAISDLDIAGFMKPASEVGGDYYDVLHHDDGRVKIGIGDVTGHGLESGMLMVMVQTAVRTLLESHETNPIRFLDILNRVIYGNVQRMQSDKNLSLALVDYRDGVMSLSGQHEELIVVRSTGDIERVDTIDLGFPIGLEENISDFIASARIPLAPGDGVVLYTDGITEAENKAGKQYGIDQLCQIVSQNWHRSAQEVSHKVVDDLQRFVGDHTVYDDITLLICKKR